MRNKIKIEKPEMSDKIKARLYPVVLELFSENDFHRVNMREISNRTGVSSGTIYKYFKSKEDLIFAILDEKIFEINDLVNSQIIGMTNIKEIFRRVFWVTMDFYDKNPGVAITAFITVPMRTWMKEQTYQRRDNLAVIKTHIDNARKMKTIDTKITDKQFMDIYYMICYRHIHNWYYSGMNQKLTDTIDEFFELFWKILKS